MARLLNGNRLKHSRYGLVLIVLISLFTTPVVAEDSTPEMLFDMLGNALVFVCAIGRIYCTAFLGGHKNANLIDYGPFSISRNPLYFCSFIGACGTVLISGYVTMIILIPAWFWLVYDALIRREEEFLRGQFGAEYEAYCARTPRLLPRLSAYHAPETVAMYPETLKKALRDSLMWFAIWPAFEIIRSLQESGVIPVIGQVY